MVTFAEVSDQDAVEIEVMLGLDASALQVSSSLSHQASSLVDPLQRMYLQTDCAGQLT